MRCFVLLFIFRNQSFRNQPISFFSSFSSGIHMLKAHHRPSQMRYRGVRFGKSVGGMENEGNMMEGTGQEGALNLQGSSGGKRGFVGGQDFGVLVLSLMLYFVLFHDHF